MYHTNDGNYFYTVTYNMLMSSKENVLVLETWMDGGRRGMT